MLKKAKQTTKPQTGTNVLARCLWQQIVKCLDVESVISWSHVCQDFHGIASDPAMQFAWLRTFMQSFVDCIDRILCDHQKSCQRIPVPPNFQRPDFVLHTKPPLVHGNINPLYIYQPPQVSSPPMYEIFLTNNLQRLPLPQQVQIVSKMVLTCRYPSRLAQSLNWAVIHRYVVMCTLSVADSWKYFDPFLFEDLPGDLLQRLLAMPAHQQQHTLQFNKRPFLTYDSVRQSLRILATAQKVVWENHAVFRQGKPFTRETLELLVRTLSRKKNNRITELLLTFEEPRSSASPPTTAVAALEYCNVMHADVLLVCLPQLEKLTMTHLPDRFWNVLHTQILANELKKLRYISCSTQTYMIATSDEWHAYLQLFYLPRIWYHFPCLLTKTICPEHIYALAAAIYYHKMFDSRTSSPIWAEFRIDLNNQREQLLCLTQLSTADDNQQQQKEMIMEALDKDCMECLQRAIASTTNFSLSGIF